jgi:tripartite-type tricarboxylate transporter receptor subunit TctC
MNLRFKIKSTCACAATVSLVWTLWAAAPAQAQNAADFYASKPQMRIIVSSTPGGGYDLFGRMVARHMSKHLPGAPSIVVQNMPGGGGITASNYLYNVAPKDGATLAVVDRGVPTAELLYGRDSNSQFDPLKLTWIGSMSKEIGVGLVASNAPAITVDEMKKREVVFGSNGLETDSSMYARLLNALLGTKIKVVVGYPGQTEYYMAMTKGETQGLFMSGWSGPNRLAALRDVEAGSVKYFVQMSSERIAEFGNTPTVFDIVKDPTDRQIVEILLSRLDLGRPFLAPPGVAADRIAMLRKAFRETAADGEFNSEITKSGNKVDPIFGEDAQKMMEKLYSTPPAVLARMKSIVKFEK